jgi:hypothetical protein
MIYVLLTNDKNNKHNLEVQKKIISYLKIHFVNIKYKFIFCPLHIIEKNLSEINNEDYVLWHPNVAANNLWLVKKFLLSVVILQHKTLLIQKSSKRNPINENIAINNGFKLLYMEPDYNDITNDDWKLVIPEEDYLIKIEKIINNEK